MCDGTGSCLADCFIGGQLYTSSEVNPGNACQVCDPTQSTSGWSNKTDGTNCDDGNLCNGVDTCQAGSCTQTTAPVSCTSPPACHNASGATCDTSTGTCTYPAAADGTICGSGQVCNGGACRSGCYINGSYYASGTPNPSHPGCQTCAPLTSISSWTNQPDTTKCDDGNACTYNDVCTSGVCGGTSYTCSAQDCRIATCNGNGTCTYTQASAGTSCHSLDPGCPSNGYCDSLGTCTRCNSSGTSCCVPTGTNSTCKFGTGTCQ